MFSVSPAFEKKVVNFSVKIPYVFTKYCLYGQFVCFSLDMTIMTKSLKKIILNFARENVKSHIITA